MGDNSIIRKTGAMELPRGAQGRRNQLSQDVASYVRELIISGQAREGDYLRIDSIARAMDVSSTPVREGLRAATDGIAPQKHERNVGVKTVWTPYEDSSLQIVQNE